MNEVEKPVVAVPDLEPPVADQVEDQIHAAAKDIVGDIRNPNKELSRKRRTKRQKKNKTAEASRRKNRGQR